jgi:cobalt-precorrin-5B (C1)-methyltransferase
MNYSTRSGYTLPVFACASAVAALRHLHQETVGKPISINLINPEEIVEFTIEQVAKIEENSALAITRSDPGDNLDLTRNTPIWAFVKIIKEIKDLEINSSLLIDDQIILQGGEGIGKQINQSGNPAIYRYAQKILRENLKPLLKPEEKIIVTIILPEGRRLAERTSNVAFGVIEGLSLLGISGISQPLSAPSQLEIYQQELAAKAKKFAGLVFCVGENGLTLAQTLGINREQIVKTANWLGPLLVNAGLQNVREILLFGYHGKLIKLAGGIFHTHHHLADGRLEILTSHCAKVGLPTSILQQVFSSATTEAALQFLRQLDSKEGSNWLDKVYHSIALTIDERTQDYIRKHSGKEVFVGSILFNRDRYIIVQSKNTRNFFNIALPNINSFEN